MRVVRGSWLVPLVLLVACGGGSGRGPDEVDAGVDAGIDPRPPFECACDDAASCDACLALVGECCYGDPGVPALDGPERMRAVLARRCESDPSCRACCDACADLTCDDLRDSGSCPPVGPAAAPSNGNRLAGFAELELTTSALAAAPEVVAQGLDALGWLSLAVECALPEGASVTILVDGEPFIFEGGIGVAPEWRDGPCDLACQEWVSSCFGWKINNYNLQVAVYPRTSDHDDVPVGRDGDEQTEDREGFDVREGAFFGNVFGEPFRLYGCRGNGRDPLYDLFRVCTHTDAHCGFVPVGPCRPGPGEDDSVPHACEGVDSHGALRGCHSRLSRPDGTWPDDAERYDRTSTVYLPPTLFQAGIDAMCGGGPAPGDHPARAVPDAPAAVGDACQTDDDCNDDGLVCRVFNGPGICVRTCTPSDDQAEEEAECGVGNTCLVHSDGQDLCVPACTPVTDGGEGCPAARVCTNFALLSFPDDPGCVNGCSTDADCLPSQECDRGGICVLREYGGLLSDRLADGEPCTLGTDDHCRGFCVPFFGDLGICASLIDLGKTTSCPDDPATMSPTTAPGDDLAICLFRSCAVNADCTPPLDCVPGPGGASCNYL